MWNLVLAGDCCRGHTTRIDYFLQYFDWNRCQVSLYIQNLTRVEIYRKFIESSTFQALILMIIRNHQTVKQTDKSMLQN